MNDFLNTTYVGGSLVDAFDRVQEMWDNPRPPLVQHCVVPPHIKEMLEVNDYTLSKYTSLVERGLREMHPEWNDAQVKLAAQVTMNKFLQAGGERMKPLTMAAWTRRDDREQRQAARVARSQARRARIRAWWRRLTQPVVAVPRGSIDGVSLVGTTVLGAAELLYDNRLGWDNDRHPYAPRAFWGALGLALGRDVSWITTTASNDEDARLTLQAAHRLYAECGGVLAIDDKQLAFEGEQ